MYAQSEKPAEKKGRAVVQSRVTAPKAWSVDQSKMEYTREIQRAHQSKLDFFIQIVDRGIHPREAAESAGDMNYRELKGTGGMMYEIRLSQGHRATFQVDDSTCTVVMLQVGGHT